MRATASAFFTFLLLSGNRALGYGAINGMRLTTGFFGDVDRRFLLGHRLPCVFKLERNLATVVAEVVDGEVPADGAEPRPGPVGVEVVEVDHGPEQRLLGDVLGDLLTDEAATRRDQRREIAAEQDVERLRTPVRGVREEAIYLRGPRHNQTEISQARIPSNPAEK